MDCFPFCCCYSIFANRNHCAGSTLDKNNFQKIDKDMSDNTCVKDMWDHVKLKSIITCVF